MDRPTPPAASTRFGGATPRGPGTTGLGGPIKCDLPFEAGNSHGFQTGSPVRNGVREREVVMVWIALLVGLVLTARAIDHQRFTHWWDFSRVVAIGASFLTWVILALVSALGIAAERRLLGEGSTWALDIAAAVLSQASLRRFRNGDRGSTLALGLLPDLNRWAEHLVALSTERWASGLDDSRLLAAAARVATSKRPRSWTGPTKQSVKTQAKWRAQLAECLTLGGHVRDQAREDLVRVVKIGYSTYLMRKM